MLVGVFTHDIVDDGSDLLLQFLYEQCCIILLMLDVTEFLFPDACEFTTLQQLFLDGINEFYTRLRGNQILPLTTDIMSFEERFDNSRS